MEGNHHHGHDHEHSNDHCTTAITSGESSSITHIDGKDRKRSFPHEHSHEHYDSAGFFSSRPKAKNRKYNKRSYTVGIGGPVGSGKTALMLALCQKMRDTVNLCAVVSSLHIRSTFFCKQFFDNSFVYTIHIRIH